MIKQMDRMSTRAKSKVGNIKVFLFYYWGTLVNKLYKFLVLHCNCTVSLKLSE